MHYELNSINKDEHKSICSHLTFTMGCIWYSSAHFLPEPQDPVLLAVYDSETGEMNFHVGYAEWDSPFAPEEFHSFDEDIEEDYDIRWISETMQEEKESSKVVAFAPLIHFWRGVGKALKVGSKYSACMSEVDENEYTLLPIDQREPDEIYHKMLQHQIETLINNGVPLFPNFGGKNKTN
ncbi:hypothetical protein [Runella limosa]|uniref:hypothetical protein n=1 Tax=Runella limosa TaxID=370978 RepID=UPI00041B0062|nr:hypothetical protein [Runella limosa]